MKVSCWPKTKYTASYTNWEYDFEEWVVTGKDDARYIDLSPCEARAFEWIHSKSESVREHARELIRNILCN